MGFFKFISNLLNLYGDFKKSVYDDISEQQKYNDKRSIINKQFNIILIINKRNDIKEAWKDIDNVLAPVASIRFNLPNFYPPKNTPSLFYRCFLDKDNMAIGHKYVKVTHNSLSQLLSEQIKNDFVLHNNKNIESLLKNCDCDLSLLWHVLIGQFPLVNNHSGLINEVSKNNEMAIQTASKNLYKYAQYLYSNIIKLNNNFDAFIKSTK